VIPRRQLDAHSDAVHRCRAGRADAPDRFAPMELRSRSDDDTADDQPHVGIGETLDARGPGPKRGDLKGAGLDRPDECCPTSGRRDARIVVARTAPVRSSFRGSTMATYSPKSRAPRPNADGSGRTLSSWRKNHRRPLPARGSSLKRNRTCKWACPTTWPAAR
jgi:hypothetical protein